MIFPRTGFSLILCFLMAGSVHAEIPGDGDDSLVTPGATVLSYCNSKIFDETAKYFNLAHQAQKHANPIKLDWKNCRIIKEETTTLTGQTVEVKKVAEKTDIEVTLEVDVGTKDGKYSSRQYWFLLHHYPMGWQIISYTLIGD